MNRISIRKQSLAFYVLFIILMIVSGKRDWEVLTGINYKLVALYSFVGILCITYMILKRKLLFPTSSRSARQVFIIYLTTSLFITVLRDGIIITYFVFMALTFMMIIIFNQLLFKIPVKDALFLVLESLLVLIVVNLYFHYQKIGRLDLLPDERTSYFRLTGIFGGGLAGALAGLSAVLPVIVFFLVGGKRLLFLLISSSFAWVVMLMADNRTAMIACLLIYLLAFLSKWRTNNKTKVSLIIVSVVAYFLIRFYIASTTGGTNINNDLEFRFKIWDFGINQVSYAPVLGYGKSNPFVTNELAKQQISFNLGDPHNSYLFCILRNGILVSFLFFLFLTVFIISAHNRVRETKYSSLLYIPLYWLLISTTGGDYFNFNLNFSSVIFGITVFGLLDHPELRLIKNETTSN